MAKGYSYKPITLPSVAFSVGGQANVSFDSLPKEDFGKPVHVAGITFDVDITAISNTTAPTRAQSNTLVKRIEIRDGRNQIRLQCGGFNGLRMKERLENGGAMVPEPDLAGSSALAHFARHWTVFPARMYGFPSDGLIPAALLHGGSIDLNFMAALTDYSADLVSMSATILPTVWCVSLDNELRIPPHYQWMEYAMAAKSQMLTGKRRLAFLGLLNDVAYGAIAAGDFGNLSVQVADGMLVNAVPAEAVNRMYQAIFRAGGIGALQGEPRAATDDNAKEVTTTSVAAVTADLQVVYAAGPDCRITKLPESDPATVSYDGSQSSGTYLAVGSFLEQPPAVLQANLEHCLSKLGKRRGPVAPKTDKQTSPDKLAKHAAFHPFSMKLV